MRQLVFSFWVALSGPSLLMAQTGPDLPYGRNQLQDPGAEAVYSADADYDPWWSFMEHEGQPYRLSRVTYGGTDSVFQAGWGKAHGHGERYFEFTAEQRFAVYSRAQVIDITAFADSIDKGRVQLRIGASLASVNSRDYHARMVVRYLDEKDEEIGSLRTQDVKRMHVMDKVWRYFQAAGSAPIPKRTRRLLVMLEMWNDAPDMPGVLAMDDLYVKLEPLR